MRPRRPTATSTQTIDDDGSVYRKKRRRFTAAIGTGVFLEWYDWQVYGFMASFLAPHFFPSNDPVTSTLSALAVFALGFVARPIGAAVLGPIADSVSHKKVLVLSVSAMAVGSLIVAVLPGYDTLGYFASAVLLIVRLGQAFATGAEMGVANAIAVELAPKGRRGRYLGLVSGSFVHAGVFGSSLVSTITSAALSSSAMAEWGWRLPFLIGGLLGLGVIYLRRAMPETLSRSGRDGATPGAVPARPAHQNVGGIWGEIWQGRVAVAAVLLVVGGAQVATYAFETAIPNLANAAFKENATTVFAITTVMGVIWILIGPWIGAFADKVGSGRAFISCRLLLAAALFLILIYNSPGIGRFAVVMVIGGTVVGLNMGLYNYISTTLMPRSVRATGVAVGYALGVSIFGGTASYLLVWTQRSGLFWLFPTYAATVSVASVLIYLKVTRKGHLYVAD